MQFHLVYLYWVDSIGDFCQNIQNLPDHTMRSTKMFVEQLRLGIGLISI